MAFVRGQLERAAGGGGGEVGDFFSKSSVVSVALRPYAAAQVDVTEKFRRPG